jgi:UPF0042 nucleotide-binding protein
VTSKKNKNIIIVSGLAGSGKTLALRALEDLGYYCIDNLPPLLLENFSQENVLDSIKSHNIALALDSRDPETPKTLKKIFETLKQTGDARVLYLEARDDVLYKRFRETRRQHPLVVGENSFLSLFEAIELDKRTLAPIRKIASRTLDTSELSSQNLKRFVYHHFSPSEKNTQLLIHLVSFGFKNGIPSDLDSVFDVRCFKNPYYDPHLRHETGMQERVKDFVFSDKNVQTFIEKVVDYVRFIYPLYLEEGKRYFSIGIGCTGGKHRSVAITEELARIFRSEYHLVTHEHRHAHKD